MASSKAPAKKPTSSRHPAGRAEAREAKRTVQDPKKPTPRKVRKRGIVESVLLVPNAGNLYFEAVIQTPELEYITLHWLGRRDIEDIHVGSLLEARGLLQTDGSQGLIYNPEYKHLTQL